MPAIRRLLLSAPLAAMIIALSGAPALAQTFATSTDLVPVQAPPGSPPAASAPPATGATPQQTRPGEGSQTPAQSIPSPTGRCTPARPTS